ncbi:MAG: hypothetical protein A2284_08415 [Deltaproteobacteria bacterium RIFOXYA12_FULL_61_11]|nr:MAG: hypothetical protein A2284_08415 [Deltaproteobacteria bacterium RIFOXYA12_FULL_61_11]
MEQTCPSEQAALQRIGFRVRGLLFFAATVPMAVLALGAYFVFEGLMRDAAVGQLQLLTADHASMVDRLLQERLEVMRLLVSTEPLERLVGQGSLEELHERLGRHYPGFFQDLGVIGSNGRHLSYHGDFDLMDKDYRGSRWFERVMLEGWFISDVFLGFRGVPHFVLAVKREASEAGSLILRSTVDLKEFSTLVARGGLGHSGDCYLLDREGRYQTKPLRGGDLMAASGLSPELFEGIRSSVHRQPDGREFLRTMMWIKGGQWLLVTQQDEDEVLAPVRRAMGRGMFVFLLGLGFALATVFFTTRTLLRMVRKAMEEKTNADRQFTRAAKLASLGEMATGLAHEINNPLAIISAEKTNLGDVLERLGLSQGDKEELWGSLDLIRKQIERCKGITSRMLKFGRQGQAKAEVLEPVVQLREVVSAMSRQAALQNVDLCLEHDGCTSEVVFDSCEFQQVFTNLITNALQAIEDNGAILVSVFVDGALVHLVVEDTGKGVESADLERCFQPFYTTKPPGKGTGLGLAVCFGAVTSWHGRIWVESESGGGAAFHITLPRARENGCNPR